MNKFTILILLISCLTASCRKGDPVIADPLEQAITILDENFLCQPVSVDENVIAVINKKNESSLCSYNKNGGKNWQIAIDNFALGTSTIQTVQSFDLKKDYQNNLILSMHTTVKDQNQQITAQKLKAVKFSPLGVYDPNIPYLEDSIYQPDIAVIDNNPLSMKGKGTFVFLGTTCLSDGGYAVVSTLSPASVDSTYLQVTVYNSNLVFTSNNHFRVLGVRDFVNAYSDSNDHLFLIYSTKSSPVTSFLSTDLKGNIVYDVSMQSYISHSYFFKETSNKYIISTSYITSDVKIKGVIIYLDKTGENIMTIPSNFEPSGIMFSVNEISDGYLFSGFNSPGLLPGGLDWRTTVAESPYQAVILKTDFEGNEVWHKVLEGNFTSVGAVSVGNDPISFFGVKYEKSIKNIFLLKLTKGGALYF